MLSWRNAPESPGTRSTTSRHARLSTAAPDVSFGHVDPASPRRSAGCAECTPPQLSPRDRADCRTPCPDTGVGASVPDRDAPRSPRRWSRRATARRARWPRPAPPREFRLRHRQSGCVSCRFSPDPWGWGRCVPPKTRLAHEAVGRLPGPGHSVQTFAVSHQHAPDFIEDALDDPALHGAMNRRIIAELFGQMVPLAAAAQVVDDAVERRAEIDAFAPRGGGRVQRLNHRRDDIDPEIVRTFPDCVDGLEIPLGTGHPWLLSLASSQRFYRHNQVF